MTVLNCIELLQNKNKDGQHLFYIPAYTKYKIVQTQHNFFVVKKIHL